MLSTSNKAAKRLQEQLINKFFEAGIGFRMLVNTAESGKTTCSIKLDRQHRGDEVIESNGVRVFLDPASAARISNYQLDYQDEPDGGFFLMPTQEVKSE
ncbi:MAG: hypothetical protein ISS51_02260 [Dehalococcoidales bacterium]|nr:hypothetical protein [Dehalococcoidales bacterium]